MFAELLDVTPAMVRQWHRRGWLRESDIVQKLPYFELTELLPAGRLAQLARNGLANAEIAKKLDALQMMFPEVERPIATLELRIDGRDIFLTKQGELVDTVGQKLFDFAQPVLHDNDISNGSNCDGVPHDLLNDASQAEQDAVDFSQFDRAFQSRPAPFQPAANGENVPAQSGTQTPDKDELCRLAYHCEEQGWLELAVDYFRAALAAGGPDASLCFQLGELLYRLDDKNAARERYYMAIEIDENFVEARACLGCVLAELGDLELAVSAFQGALQYHPDYADAHYHLAAALQKLGKTIEAEQHRARFRELMPNSPWGEKDGQEL